MKGERHDADASSTSRGYHSYFLGASRSIGFADTKSAGEESFLSTAAQAQQGK